MVSDNDEEEDDRYYTKENHTRFHFFLKMSSFSWSSYLIGAVDTGAMDRKPVEDTQRRSVVRFKAELE